MPFLKENGVLAPMPHLAMLGVGCPLWVGTSANVPNFQGHPPPGAKKSLDRHANCPKKAKNHPNAGCDKKQPTPRPKWQRSVSISNQLQKPARNTCGHALARFWPPGPVQQARGLAWWVPPGLMHFFGLGGISRKFPSLGGQHATLPMCLTPKMGAP